MAVLDFEDFFIEKKEEKENEIHFTNDKNYILRENDIITLKVDISNLFDEFESEQDNEGNFLRFPFIEKYRNVKIYSYYDCGYFLLFDDERTIYISMYESINYLKYKNVIVFHGSDSVFLVDIEDFVVDRKYR